MQTIENLLAILRLLRFPMYGLLVFVSIAQYTPNIERRNWWQNTRKFLLRPSTYLATVLVTFLCFRIDYIACNEEFNIDESIFLAAAKAVWVAPSRLLSVDIGSCGVLNLVPLLTLKAIGMPLDYISAHLAAFLLLSSLFVLLFLNLAIFVPAQIAKLSLLPTITFYFTFVHGDFVYLNSELLPTVIVVACLLGVSRLLKSPHSAHHPARLLAAGLGLGALPFTKLQSIPIGAGIALYVAAYIVLRRKYVCKPYASLALFIFGGGLFPALWLISQLGADNLGDYLMCLQRNLAYSKSGSFMMWKLIFDYFLYYPNTRFLFLSQIGIVLLCTVLMTKAAIAKRPTMRSPHLALSLLVVCILAFALYAVIKPGRFFHHYMTFVIFPMPLLMAPCLFWLYSTTCRWVPRGRRHLLRTISVSLLLLITVVPQWYLPYLMSFRCRPILGKRPPEIAITTRFLIDNTQQGNSMVVWGWMPEYFVRTGLVMGSREPETEWQIDSSPLQDYFVSRLVQDMNSTPPTIFVDAVSPSSFKFKDSAYRIDSYPRVSEFVKKNYILIADIKGIRVFRLKSSHSSHR